jgi:hypothetical protein
MAAKTIRKPDLKTVRKMTTPIQDGLVFGGSLYIYVQNILFCFLLAYIQQYLFCHYRTSWTFCAITDKKTKADYVTLIYYLWLRS